MTNETKDRNEKLEPRRKLPPDRESSERLNHTACNRAGAGKRYPIGADTNRACVEKTAF